MPNNTWFCNSCKVKNPPYTEVCRECGNPPVEVLVASDTGPNKHVKTDTISVQESISAPHDVTEDTSRRNLIFWAVNFPAEFALVVAVLSLLLFAPSTAQLFPLVWLVFFGFYPFDNLVLGFTSISGAVFNNLSIKFKFIVFAFVLLHLVTAIGMIFFVYIFANVYLLQWHCGSYCFRQNDDAIFVMLFSVVVLWLSYFVTCMLSTVLTGLDWWPSGIEFNFTRRSARLW